MRRFSHCEGFRRVMWLSGGCKAFSYKSSNLEGERIVEVAILLNLSEENWSSIIVLNVIA